MSRRRNLATVVDNFNAGRGKPKFDFSKTICIMVENGKTTVMEGSRKMGDEEAKAYLAKMDAEGKAEEAKRLADKGHDCWDNVTHSPKIFSRGRRVQNDAYYCAVCGDLLQVG